MRLTTELRNQFIDQGWVLITPDQARSLGLEITDDKIFNVRLFLSSRILNRLGLGNEGLIEQFFNFCPLGNFPAMEQATEAGLMTPNPSLQSLFVTLLGVETKQADKLVRRVFSNQIKRAVGENIVLATGQMIHSTRGRPVAPWGIPWHVGAVLRILHRMVVAQQNQEVSGEDLARRVALLPMPFFVLSLFLPLTDMQKPGSGEMIVRTGSHRVIREYLNQERDSMITRCIGNYDQRNLLGSSIEMARKIFESIEELLEGTEQCYPIQSILCETGSVIIASPYLYTRFNELLQPEITSSAMLSWRYWGNAAAHYPRPKENTSRK